MDKMKNLENQKIGIFGYGSEGKSLFNFLIKHGCKNIKIFDEKEPSRDLEGESRIVSGNFESGDYSDLNVVFRSPGIRLQRLKKFLPDSVEVSSPTNLFFELSKAHTVGITGTKGKSTTALLVAKLLETNGCKVYVVGNIGDPMLDVLDEADENSYCVVELSSFQLQGLTYKPETAIILPILIDHLDYHDGQEEYFLAKMNILSDEKQAVICDAKTSEKLPTKSSDNIITYSVSQDDANCIQDDSGFLCDIANEKKILEGAVDFASGKQIPAVDLLAAYAFACSQNLDFDLSKFSDFEKLPLRVQMVGSKKGVKFFNDSASTNPLSTSKAMEMMTDPYFLILGGSAKGIAFDELAQQIARDTNLEKVFLFGATAAEIANLIKRLADKPLVVKGTLSDVFVDLPIELNEIGSVLFSPACASFDQYKNYKERGDDFNRLISLINE